MKSCFWVELNNSLFPQKMTFYLTVVLTVLVLVVDQNHTTALHVRVVKEQTLLMPMMSDPEESAPSRKNMTVRRFLNATQSSERSKSVNHPYIFNDHPNLVWEWSMGEIPNGAVGIWNGYTGRYDYVCKTSDGCETGFFYSEYGECLFPRYPELWGATGFYLLVNKDNFEFLEWKSDSKGSVPKNSVRSCSETDKTFVGKNKYGLGLIQAGDSFYLPWVQKVTDHIYGYAQWYRKSYEALTINTDQYSQQMLNVEYYIDQTEMIKNPPFAVDVHKVFNKDCNSATMTTTLSTTQTKTSNWQISYSASQSMSSTVTAGIPDIMGGSITIGETQTIETSGGMSYSQSQTTSLTVDVTVPPNKVCTVEMSGVKYTVDIPFKALLGHTYSNGDTRWTTITGTYKGVQTSDFNAIVERCEPVADPVPCN